MKKDIKMKWFKFFQKKKAPNYRELQNGDIITLRDSGAFTGYTGKVVDYNPKDMSFVLEGETSTLIHPNSYKKPLLYRLIVNGENYILE